jgi:STE24 endopeptidase
VRLRHHLRVLNDPGRLHRLRQDKGDPPKLDAQAGGRPLQRIGRRQLLAVAILVVAVMAVIAPPLLAQAFDPQAATDQMLASVPADARARSDAYFEGGYWIRLWSTLIAAGLMIVLLHTGLSRRLREHAERLTRRRPLQVAAYAVMFIALTSIVTFPFALYTDFFREHQYGLATQTLPAWLGDQVKAFAIGLILGSLALAGLYGVLCRTPRTWWLWGTIFVIALQMLGAMVFPVFIAPVFNTYTRLEDPAVRDPILRLARANGIHATEVWQVDASRQTNRISANVSGMLGTERITLNDNLLKRCSQECIEAVMGHEMGHYVLNHVYELVIAVGLVTLVSFAVAQWAFERFRGKYESRWGVRDIADPAGLPLLVLILTIYGAVMFPVMNTLIRTNESEADVFGLNATRQPEGFAEAALKLGEYRKLDPSPWEERLMYDHPSGRTRIFAAMTWKAEQALARKPDSVSATAPPPTR